MSMNADKILWKVQILGSLVEVSSMAPVSYYPETDGFIQTLHYNKQCFKRKHGLCVADGFSKYWKRKVNCFSSVHIVLRNISLVYVTSLPQKKYSPL